jgi:hypothetical protein
MKTIDMLCLMILISLALARLEKRVGARLDRIERRFDALQEQRCNTTDAPQAQRNTADGKEAQ